jgi:hypothetical protein
MADSLSAKSRPTACRSDGDSARCRLESWRLRSLPFAQDRLKPGQNGGTNGGMTRGAVMADDEVVVTPAMAEAGVRASFHFRYVTEGLGVYIRPPKEYVAAIYRAMRALEPPSGAR